MITKSMMVRVGADTREMERGLKSAEARMKKFSEQCTKIGRGMTIAGVAIIAALTLVTKKASDAQETYAKFGTVFKDSFAEAEQAVTELTKRYGLSTLAAKDMLSATGDLLTGLGMQGDVALSLSRRTQKLSVDLASFTNFSGGAKGASEALTKAMLGERESIKALGIVIDEEMVKEWLLAQGKEKLTGLALKQAKAEATLAIATAQSKNAVGDYERTSGSLANVVRRLVGRLEDLWVVIGTKLIPTATKYAEKITDIVERTKEWTEAYPALASKLTKGAAALSGTLVALGGIGIAVPKVVGGFKMLLKFGKLLISPLGLLAIAITAIAVSVKMMIDNLNEAKKAMSDFADEAAVFTNAAENFKKLWITVRKEGGEALEQFNELFKRFGGNWDSIMKTIIRDPKFAALKILLLEIASGVKTVELEGKELSIKLPKHIQKVNESLKGSKIFWLEFAKAATEAGKVIAAKLMMLKGLAGKPLDLGPAFAIPDFTLAKQKFESFKEFTDAWWEALVAKAQTKWEAFMEGSRAVVAALDSVFGQFHENEAIRIDNEEKKKTDAIESWYERERERLEATVTNEEEKVAALEALDEEKARKENALQHKVDKERRKLERKEAKTKKVTALFSAGINLAEAITKVFAQTGILGIVFSAVVAGLIGIQIAAIAAAPLPALQKGGRIEKAAIVGERGAELFVPDRPGTIIPLRGGAGMARARAFTFSPIVNIYTKTLDDYAIDRAAEKIFAALEKERERFG